MIKYLILACFFLIISCGQENYNYVVDKKGKIDIITNVYYNASNNLDDVETFHVSKLNYLNNDIVEIVPSLKDPTIDMYTYFINDSLYYDLSESNSIATINISKHINYKKPKHVINKTQGSLFKESNIPGYENRLNITDTILFGKEYARFDVNTKEHFSRYYIYKTDTLLPYSINRMVEIEYQGRLERIDSYDKKSDMFVTLQLMPKKTLDAEVQRFFDYNIFIRNKINKNE